MSQSYFSEILELIKANGWENQLIVEQLEGSSAIQVRLGHSHRTDPDAVVNEYIEGVHSFEQIQQECLRSLRTGRPGL